MCHSSLSQLLQSSKPLQIVERREKVCFGIHTNFKNIREAYLTGMVGNISVVKPFVNLTRAEFGHFWPIR